MNDTKIILTMKIFCVQREGVPLSSQSSITCFISNQCKNTFLFVSISASLQHSSFCAFINPSKSFFNRTKVNYVLLACLYVQCQMPATKTAKIAHVFRIVHFCNNGSNA